MTVITVQSIVGANPYKSLPVLQNTIDLIVAEPVLDRKLFKIQGGRLGMYMPGKQ
jgi:hypothetical protein